MKALDQFSELFSVDSVGEWSTRLFRLCESYGFQQMLFALVPQPGQPLEEAFLRSSYAEEWRHTYDSSGLHQTDPTVIHCVYRTTPLIWSPEIFATPDQKGMYEEACHYGLRSGVTLPIHGPRGELGMMCYVNDAAPDKKNTRDLIRHLPELALLRDFAFDSSRRFALVDEQGEAPVLTKRELECLLWAANGKTSWEIARILICSEAGINFHMGNIRRKLDVTTRREAVVKALRLGLLKL